MEYFPKMEYYPKMLLREPNTALKRCENCGLKSVVEKHVFSVSKKKKKWLVSWFKQHFSVFKKYKICVWYVCFK